MVSVFFIVFKRDNGGVFRTSVKKREKNHSLFLTEQSEFDRI